MSLRPPPPPARDPLIGRQVGGKYIIRALVGRGGFGAVYRAEQAAVSRAVAIKVIHPDRTDCRELRRRFVLEASAIAAVSHPCVLSLFDHGVEPDGLMYMALEYVDGRPLSDVIVSEGPLGPSRAVDLMRQVVAGVAEAHRFGVVHRDLKPANIMVARDAIGIERVKVLDFGIAKLFAHPTAEATREGLMLGTPKYASPEQIRARGVGPWSDQYGIGAVLFHLLAGHAPFIAPSVPEVLAMHLREPAPRLGDGVPDDLAALVDRCMAKRPVDRFPDLPALARALDRAADRLVPWLPATERMRLEDSTVREHVPPVPLVGLPQPQELPPLDDGFEHPSIMAGAVEHDPVAPDAARRPDIQRLVLGFILGTLALLMIAQALPGGTTSPEVAVASASAATSGGHAIARDKTSVDVVPQSVDASDMATDPIPDRGVRKPSADAETYTTLDITPTDAGPPDASSEASPALVAEQTVGRHRVGPKAKAHRSPSTNRPRRVTRPLPDHDDSPNPRGTTSLGDAPSLRLDWLHDSEDAR